MWSSSPKFSLVVSTESATEKHYNPNTEHMCLSHWKWKPNPKFHLPVNLNDHFWTVYSGITICLHHFLSLNTVKVKQHPSQATYFTVKKNMQKRFTLLCREGDVHFTRISFYLSKHSSCGYTFLPSPRINFMALYTQTKTNQIYKIWSRSCGQAN